jgi:RNA polymerase sigma factor (sigma-70 family)
MSPRLSIRLLAAQSDQRLAVLSAEGHERAFEALVQRYRRPLLRYCRRMQLADARAEDVLQQAFLQAWMAFARGTEVRDVRPWLYRIVHNAAVNVMRGAAESHGELTEAMQAKAALTGESNLQRTMAVREALTDVAALPQMQQQAIFLTAVDGQTHDEVATVLGISEGALRGLLYRARASLRGAAAALTPPPLLEWAARGADSAGPTAERLAELSAGGGAAGMTGLLMKGAVVAVTAGAVATGATVVNSHHRSYRPVAHRAAVAALAGSTAERGSTMSGVPLVPESSPQVGPSKHAFVHRPGRGRGHDGSGGRSRARHSDRVAAGPTSHSGSRSDGGGGGGQARDGGGSSANGVSDGKGAGSGAGTQSSESPDRSASSGAQTDGGASGRERSQTDAAGQSSPASPDGSSGDGGGSGSGSGSAEAPPGTSGGSGDAPSVQESEATKHDS